MTRPNIIFLVWDSARCDYTREHAPNLASLGEDNLQFVNAIAPSTWSLPSHVSVFSGEYPHEHGTYRVDQTVSRLPLVERLRRDGYDCYGVSGNGFASPRIGFDHSFDEFHDTRNSRLSDSGLSVRYVAKSFREEGYSMPMVAAKTFYAALTNDEPRKSVTDFVSVARSHLANHDLLRQLPLIRTEQSTAYKPETNTAKIGSIIESHAKSSDPFFVFANYMDCHRPYDPPNELQQKHLGTTVDDDELDRLNDDVSQPWKFVERVEGGEGVTDEDLQTIRGLYAGEVESVDRHLERILAKLDAHGLRENTLVVVTADHGENLGEVDAMGRQRIGHEGSVSDDLVRVPLVVANPALDGATVDEYVSIKDLYELFTDGIEQLFSSAGENYDALLPSENLVLSEYPAAGGEELFEKYPDVPDAAISDRISEHTVVAYHDDWRVVVDSTGNQWAWYDGEEAALTEAPAEAITACQDALQELERSTTEYSLTDEEREQLEALGYM